MQSHRSLLFLLAIPPTLAACLETPPVAAIDAAGRDGTGPDHDAAGLDAEPADAMLPPCLPPACEQVLAIGLWTTDPDLGTSVQIRHRLDDAWAEIPVGTNGPVSNVFDLEWGDCCGAGNEPDGVPDLLTAEFYGIKYTQLRRPAGSLMTIEFKAPPQVGGPGGDAQARWLDVDGDTRIDIVTGRPYLRWHRNNASNPNLTGFDDAISLDGPVNDGAYGPIAIGNWDADPQVEIVVGDHRATGGTTSGRGVTVLEHTAGGWDTFVPVLPDFIPHHVLWCDLHDDPGLDLVVSTYAQVDVYPNRGTSISGSWIDLSAKRSYLAINRNWAPLVCGDVNGDDLSDLLIVAGDGLRVVLHGSTAASLIWSPTTITATTIISDVALADLAHDRVPEILVTVGDDDPEEDVAEPVAYLLPNLTTGAGTVTLGTPEVLLSARVDGMSLAYLEYQSP